MRSINCCRCCSLSCSACCKASSSAAGSPANCSSSPACFNASLSDASSAASSLSCSASASSCSESASRSSSDIEPDASCSCMASSAEAALLKSPSESASAISLAAGLPGWSSCRSDSRSDSIACPCSPDTTSSSARSISVICFNCSRRVSSSASSSPDSLALASSISWSSSDMASFNWGWASMTDVTSSMDVSVSITTLVSLAGLGEEANRSAWPMKPISRAAMMMTGGAHQLPGGTGRSVRRTRSAVRGSPAVADASLTTARATGSPRRAIWSAVPSRSSRSSW